jgi:hypothetical protein
MTMIGLYVPHAKQNKKLTNNLVLQVATIFLL